MSQSELRRRMRGSDAMFLYFEKKEMPLHIGAVAVLDGPFDEESERLLAARLPEMPRYRQRVLFPPYGVAHPSWEYDPAFDIRNHIQRVKLDPPGTDRQLSELAGSVFTKLMDRNKPLWDLTVVDGLEGGRSALICRVHHCLVDGVSGIGLVNVMFDPTRTPRTVEARPYNPPPLPEPGQQLVEGLASFWADAAERLIGSQITLLKIAQAFTGDTAKNSLKALLAAAPDLMKPTERLPFNSPCSGERGHCWATFPFGEARAIRAALGGTINDVALAAVSGAVSRYTVAHRQSVKGRFVRLMVPVNLRTEDPRGSVGNDISMLPLSIPLDIEDPAERLRTITLRSSAMKAARIADIIGLIGTWLGWTPPAMQQSLAALPFMPQPVMIVNMVCTNVPGPMTPLYSNGRQLLTYYPHVPCGSEVGISVAIASYNQNLHYGVVYDMQAAPDGELFRDFLIESYEELRRAAGVAPMKAATPKAQAAAAAPVPVPEELRAHRAREVEVPEKAAEPVVSAPVEKVLAEMAPAPVVAAEQPEPAAVPQGLPHAAAPEKIPVKAAKAAVKAEPKAPQTETRRKSKRGATAKAEAKATAGAR
jgi:WS/DGAT/MGAT family acyltransferase